MAHGVCGTGVWIELRCMWDTAWGPMGGMEILPHSLYGHSPGDYALESCSLAGGGGVGSRNLSKFCPAVPCITQATLELFIKAQTQRASLGT